MKNPIIPTVEAIEDLQRCIDYWGRRTEKAEAENARLLEQSRLGDAAIDQLTKEREDYRMRWLGSMTPEDAALIRAENERLRAALTPSAETKAAYIGEFTMDLRQLDEFGVEQTARITIPWTSVKEIMRAIQKYADEQVASSKNS